jgi:type IV pilus modification protein PilV
MRLSQQGKVDRSAEPLTRGMTMIELLIAMSVLAIGMGAMLTVFAAAISHNGQAKSDTAGTMLAQAVLERIAAQPASSNANLTLSDCNPNGATQWTIATAPGGANLDAATVSSIDWTQAYAGIIGNYKMQYVACGNNGRQVTYDVRWHITTISLNARLIIVSARPLAADGATGFSAVNNFAQPITLRTIGGV